MTDSRESDARESQRVVYQMKVGSIVFASVAVITVIGSTLAVAFFAIVSR